jgi:hypothetical protein
MRKKQKKENEKKYEKGSLDAQKKGKINIKYSFEREKRYHNSESSLKRKGDLGLQLQSTNFFFNNVKLRMNQDKCSDFCFLL